MELSHFEENGRAVMVDVTRKDETQREAEARGTILVNREVFEAIRRGTVGKGDVLGVAQTAGIMGAKRTSDLIPMCHILPITGCRITFDMDEAACAVHCACTVKITGKTGPAWRWRPSQESAWRSSPSMTCARRWISPWRSRRSIWSARPGARAAKCTIPGRAERN